MISHDGTAFSPRIKEMVLFLSRVVAWLTYQVTVLERFMPALISMAQADIWHKQADKIHMAQAGTYHGTGRQDT